MSVVKVQGNASGTGILTIAAPNTNSDRTLTLPDQTGTVLTNAGPFTANASASNGAVTIDASNNVGIGTSSPGVPLDVVGEIRRLNTNQGGITLKRTDGVNSNGWLNFVGSDDVVDGSVRMATDVANALTFQTAGSERARIDSSGNLLVGTTDSNVAANNGVGINANNDGLVNASRNGGHGLDVNRKTSDGNLVVFRQDGTVEGTISVSGTTVSYNGGHLSRWAQTEGPKDTTLVKGTVLSNLDAMNEYFDADGNPVPNEQLNKVKVSDVEGDTNVAGVFVNWSYDEDHNVDEINMAMTGDMIIRIAQGVTVQRGDLLMSAGDGTAKPQGDDIVRSKTVAKVTSTHITCTYADGSYCVPCVLMAC